VNTLVNPINPETGSEDTDVYHKIDNSLIQNYLEGDSYMAKVSGGGMTNARALQVLAKIERKLVGYNGPTERPLAVKKQVQDLIGEATDIENLSQGTSFHLLFPASN
jgi:FKBP12-rapamycin complex-associated protein